MSEFYRLCRRYPPPLVRLLARRGRRAMSTAEIASATASTHLAVEAISSEPSWDRITLDQLRKFTSACGLDFTSRRDVNRVECYWRLRKGHPKFQYLTEDPNWRGYYLPFIVSWRRGLAAIPAELPAPIRRLLESLKL